MSVESARYEVIRQHEWPFNSDNKYMAVLVTPRRSQVWFCFYGRFLLTLSVNLAVLLSEIFLTITT